MVSMEIGSMWQYRKGTGRPSNWTDEEWQVTLAHFLACPPMRLIAFIQIISQWPADETQKPNSSICKPCPTLHQECLGLLAAVRQDHGNHDQSPHCSQCKACAGRAADGESSHCLWSLLHVSTGFGAAHAAGLPSGSTVLGQICCP